MTTVEQQRRHALEQIAEIKRILCATEHAFENQVPATLLVTSAAHGEGKSLFAAALAVTAARSGKYRVAVLDLNWYHPALHHFFNVEQRRSSKDIFTDELSELVTPSGQDSLDLLTAPCDYADQSRTSGGAFTVPERLIRQARDTYDLVIIDSAAVFPTNRMMMDPVMLSSVADGVVMVVLAGVTPRQQVRRAQKIMDTAGAKLLGAISNQWKLSAHK